MAISFCEMRLAGAFVQRVFVPRDIISKLSVICVPPSVVIIPCSQTRPSKGNLSRKEGEKEEKAPET